MSETPTEAQNLLRPVVGVAYRIPKGAPVHSMRTGKWRATGRSFDVYPTDIRLCDGYREVTWPGSSGYWQRVIVTDDGRFLAAYPKHRTRPA